MKTLGTPLLIWLGICLSRALCAAPLCHLDSSGYLPDQMGTLQNITITNQGLKTMDIQLVTLKPDHYKASLYLQGKSHAQSISHVVRQHNAIIGINGGYFTPQFNPLGLVKIKGRMLQKPHQSALLSATIGINPQGQIDLLGRYNPQLYAPTMFQTGPILVNHGNPVVSRQYHYHNRTILAVDAKHDLLIFNTSPTTLYRIAQLMALDSACFDDQHINQAVALDGGSSSGLIVMTQPKPLLDEAITKVPMVLTFRPKKNE